MGVCFLVNLMTSSSDPTCQYFGLQYFFESRPEYAFLEPLIEFPAFLVQKLGQKQLIGKGLFSILLGISQINFKVFLAQILEQGTLKTHSDPSKSQNVTKNIKKKNRHPKLKCFFLLQTTYLHQSLEDLNSSLVPSDGELLPGVKCPPKWLLMEQNFGQFLVYGP